MSDLDNILDGTLDDIADLPEFKNFPPGTHRVTASFSADTIKGKPCIKLDFKYIEALELANPEDEAPKAGDGCGLMFTMNNQFGQGAFKKAAAPFAQALNFSTTREIVEGVQDVECAITTKLRKDNNDPDKVYLNLVELAVI